MRPLTINALMRVSPGRRQAIILISAGKLLNRHLETNFVEILIDIYTFAFNEMHLKMSSEKMAAILPQPQWINLHLFISRQSRRFTTTIDKEYNTHTHTHTYIYIYTCIIFVKNVHCRCNLSWCACFRNCNDGCDI